MQTFITVYAEQTPNPETLKFVFNKPIAPRGVSFDFPTKEDAERSPLAKALFEFDYVKGVFIGSDFVTITKTQDKKWVELIPAIRTFLKDYIMAGGPVVTDTMMEEVPSFAPDENDSEVVAKIKEILAKNVRPVVEMDGGAIDFVDYQDGVVTLAMKGACSGCPSSTVTLKSGIEGLLKRQIPEIKEVVAEAM